jgi:hypothetical protein
LALIGSVFAIVGFFGFKSISDTRQATLDAAKIKAEAIAKDIAEKKTKEITEEYIANYVKSEKLLSIVTDSASKKAEEISFKESQSVATTVAKEEFGKYIGSQKEENKANRQELIELKKELTELKKDYYFLKSWIRFSELTANPNILNSQDEEQESSEESELNTDDKPIV